MSSARGGGRDLATLGRMAGARFDLLGERRPPSGFCGGQIPGGAEEFVATTAASARA